MKRLTAIDFLIPGAAIAAVGALCFFIGWLPPMEIEADPYQSRVERAARIEAESRLEIARIEAEARVQIVREITRCVDRNVDAALFRQPVELKK